METSTYKFAKNPDATKTFGFWRGLDVPSSRRKRKVLFVDAESTGIGGKNRKKIFSSRKHEILHFQRIEYKRSYFLLDNLIYWMCCKTRSDITVSLNDSLSFVSILKYRGTQYIPLDFFQRCIKNGCKILLKMHEIYTTKKIVKL